MAEIDSRIAMGVQPLDIGASIGRGYLLRDLAAQSEARALDTKLKQQAMQKLTTLGDFHKMHTNGGKLDRAAFAQSMADAGYGADIPAMQKEWGDSDKSQMESRAKQIEIGIKANDYTTKAIAGLMMRPGITPADVHSEIGNLAKNGVLTPEQAQTYSAQVPNTTPQALDNWLRSMFHQALSTKEQLERLTPKVQAQNLGGRTVMVDTNPMTNPGVVGQEYQRTATPGEVESARHNRASEGLTARGQNLADSRAREANANNLSRPFEVTGEDGKPVLVQQDKAGNIRPVQGYAPKGGAGTSKPLPTAALKMIQEGKDAIGTASSINADLGAISQQITDGNLSFGPVSNLWNAARNAAGSSTEQSRNFASFKASLEKLRNDSLRLNKGVQTDGDAQRAWNELFQNINDTKLVQKRLGEIKRINDRAVQLRQLDIDGVLQNYDHSPMDTGAYTRQPSALSVGGSALPPRDAPANSSIDALLDKYK